MALFLSTKANARRAALLGTAVLAVGTLATSTAVATTTGVASASQPSISISETGSTLLYPLFQLWSTAYHKQHPNVTITPQGTGSGTGISDASEGTVDIGASDAYLSTSQRAQSPGLMNIALAISAQQVNYNVSGLSPSTHLKLTGKILSAIYRGMITSWDDPQIRAINPGVKLPDEKIVALHRSDSSGDTFLFSSYLSKSDPSVWGKTIGYGTSISFPAIANALGEEGNGGMVTGCKDTPGCVAYIGISYLTETQKAHLGEAELQNSAGQFLLPTASTIIDEASSFTSRTPADESLSMIYGKGYPITNYEYAIIPPKEASPVVAKTVQDILTWAINPKQGSSPAFLGAVKFQPLPPAVRALSERQIAKIRG
ncbi:MAG: phosphate ABC transporter substrate-binding protein PstS [Acidimicrobiales bacterium]